MVAGGDDSRPTGSAISGSPTFRLERFAWAAPDRLEVAGKFIGLRDAPADAPVLLVRAADRTHRLPAVPDSVSGPPENGRRWLAEFAWREPPVAFEAAELGLGGDIVVALPEPGGQGAQPGDGVLEVRRVPAEGVDEAPPEDAAGGAAGRLRLHAELLAAHEEVRELRAAVQRTEEELARARADLNAERERHAADAERFRAGLATVQGTADDALAAERSAVQQLGKDLRVAQDAIDAREAALGKLRGQVEAAVAAREQGESKARAEVEALRERVASLEHAGQKAEQLRVQLSRTRKQAEGQRAELDELRSAVEQARTDAERLLDRLTTVRDATGGRR